MRESIEEKRSIKGNQDIVEREEAIRAFEEYEALRRDDAQFVPGAHKTVLQDFVAPLETPPPAELLAARRELEQRRARNAALAGAPPMGHHGAAFHGHPGYSA